MVVLFPAGGGGGGGGGTNFAHSFGVGGTGGGGDGGEAFASSRGDAGGVQEGNFSPDDGDPGRGGGVQAIVFKYYFASGGCFSVRESIARITSSPRLNRTKRK